MKQHEISVKILNGDAVMWIEKLFAHVGVPL
jgi:hypothetical protein